MNHLENNTLQSISQKFGKKLQGVIQQINGSKIIHWFKLPLAKSLQSLITSSFIMGQHFLKKAPFKPSGLGA
jgi:hypothetical protein